jgi:hypothetical protein
MRITRPGYARPRAERGFGPLEWLCQLAAAFMLLAYIVSVAG